MPEGISPEATHNRICAEIQRRSESQEKATNLNILALSTLFGWALSGKFFHPGIYLIAAFVNSCFALKWLSEDKNIAGLNRYLRTSLNSPLETWQRENFSSIYPKALRVGDFIWRMLLFVVPGFLSLALLSIHLLSISASQFLKYLLGIGLLLAFMCFVWIVKELWGLGKPWGISKSGD